MSWLEEKIEKWRKNLKTHSDCRIAETVMRENETLFSSDEDGRAKWVENALLKMAELIPDISVRKKIMSCCSCVFTEEFGDSIILELRETYRQSKNIDDVIRKMKSYPNKFAFTSYENGVIKEKRQPRDPQACASARSFEEKKLAACFCPLARAGKVPFPEPFCSCSAGWYAGIWEGVLEKPVEVKVVKSLLYGDETCEFEIKP